MTSASLHSAYVRGAGKPVGQSAEITRNSRPMSCAVACTWESGGRRSTNGVPSASTRYVMLDRPWPMTTAVRASTGTTCSLNQGMSVSYLMPGGALWVSVIGCSSALPGDLLPALLFSFRRLLELKRPVVNCSGGPVGGDD